MIFKTVWKLLAALMKKRWFKISTSVICVILSFYLMCLNYAQPTDLPIARDIFSGETWNQGGGWHLTAPWVEVAVIDTRPMRVEVTSAGHGFSAKLIQFDRKYWRDFVNTEGFYYYWWANRFSINFGYSEEHRGVRDIMRGYAYSAKHYPFLEIINEYQQ